MPLQEFDDEEALGFISFKEKRKFPFRFHSKRINSKYIAAALISVLLIAVIVVVAVVLTTPKDENLEKLSQYVKAAVDTSADPCNDFYQYSCGNWIDAQTQSAERSFDLAQTIAFTKVAQIVKSQPASSPIGILYQDCITKGDSNLDLLQDWIKRIENINDTVSLFNVVAQFHNFSLPALFQSGVTIDPANPYAYIWILSQGGLTLRNPAFYLSNDTFDSNRRDQMLYVMEEVFTEMNDRNASQTAQNVFDFETSLARIFIDESTVDPPALFNPYNQTTLQSFNLPLSEYFSSLGIQIDSANVETPIFFQQLSNVLNSTSYDTIKSSLKFTLVLHTNSFLSDSTIRFKGILSGLTDPNVESLCISSVDTHLGDMIGKIYSDDIDSAKTTVAEGIISDIKNAFVENLATIDWMDQTTKDATTQKLQAIKAKVIHPSEWTDYSSIPFQQGHYFDNLMALMNFNFQEEMKQLKLPVDKKEWLMTPQTVNAYYFPNNNEICLPDAIMQKPFYDPTFPAFTVYGGLSSVLGHEIAHAFDSSGRWYDANGTLRDWWTENVTAVYDAKAQCVVGQYDRYQPYPGVTLNGKMTEGENIADLGAIRLAYLAYKNQIAARGQGYKEKLIRKYFSQWTDDQLFFISYAQVWCEKTSKSAVQMSVRLNSHSPAEYRVLGSVSSFDKFGEAFNCPVGSPMRPQNTCRVW